MLNSYLQGVQKKVFVVIWVLDSIRLAIHYGLKTMSELGRNWLNTVHLMLDCMASLGSLIHYVQFT